MKSKKGFQVIWGILMVSAAMICLLAPNQAAGDQFVNVTIDDMTVPFGSSGSPPLLNTDLVPPPNPPPLVLRASQPPPILPQANVLGGARVMELDIFASGTASGKAYIDGNPDPLLRSWVISNDTGSDGGGRIIWNGSNNLADPLGCALPQPNTVGYCVSCTWDKFYSLKLGSVSNDQDTTWHVTLFSPGGSSTYSFFQAGNTPATNPEILRAQFQGNVNFANLCRIDISMDHANDLDTSLVEVTAVLDIPPDIHCVSPKLLGLTTADMKQHLILPPGTTFDGDLFAELSVTNAHPASPTQVVIEDALPAGMSFQGIVNVVSPVGFNLGPDPAIGSTGTISWTSVSSLDVDQTLTFTFKVHLTLNAPGTVINSFRAEALGGTFPADVCQGDVTLPPTHKIPSLNEWSAIILTLLLAASAVLLLRKRRVS